MPAPLYDGLRALADAHPLRLDMPGHPDARRSYV